MSIPPPVAGPPAPIGDAPPGDGLTPFGLHPAVKEAMKHQERRLREQIAAESRVEAAKAVATSSNGKPRIPSAWVPYLYVGLTVCGAITTALIGDESVPKWILKVAAVGTLAFGGLLAGSPGLRKGAK